MSRCCIALGGNTGNPELSFSQALARIEHYGVEVVQISSTILTPAMGAAAGCDFLNAAAVLETDLSPTDVLELLHHVESGFGRKRGVHWGPRAIDLDLLFYEQQTCDTNDLVLPHPCLWYRRFVLEPLVQVAPGWIHPTLAESVSDLRSKLQDRPLHLEVVKGGRMEFAAIAALAETMWDGSRLELTLVNEIDSPAGRTFARLIEDSTSTRAQPQLESSRIVRVPINDESRLDAQWQNFLQDFGTAAFG